MNSGGINRIPRTVSIRQASGSDGVSDQYTMKATDDQSRIEILVRRPVSTCSAFTLLELLSVIAIMGVLITLLFPAIAAVKESGRKATAGAEVHRIATAVMAFKTEYGKLPTLPKLPKDREGMDLAVGDPAVGMKIPNRELFYISEPTRLLSISYAVFCLKK